MTRRVMTTSPYPRMFQGPGECTLSYSVARQAWLCCAHVLRVDIDFPLNTPEFEAIAEARACGVPIEWVSHGDMWSDCWRGHFREGDLTVGLTSGKVDT